MKVLRLLPLLGLLACEKTLEGYEIPNPGDKLYMEAYLTNRSPLEVILSRTTYIFDNVEPILNQQGYINLYQGEQLLTTLREQGRRDGVPIYAPSENYFLLAGEEYRLEAVVDGFPVCVGRTRIPLPIQVSVEQVQQIPNDGRINFTFSFRDSPGRGHIYRLRLISPNPDEAFFLPFSTLDPRVEILDEFSDVFGDDDPRRYGVEAYLTDAGRDGQTFSVEMRIEQPFAQPLLYLDVVTEDLYRYERSKILSQENDLFFSEPVSLHRNVEGGYGVVVGFSGTSALVQ